jgi:hypothetical protein
MSIRGLLQQTFCLTLVVLSLIRCGGASTESSKTQTSIPPTATLIPPTATPVPITEQESQELLEEWGFEPILSIWGEIRWEANGKLTEVGDLAVQFLMNNPPAMTFVEEGEEFFKFEKSMPRGNSAAVVILTTPELEGAQAMIPRFTPTLIDSSGSTISDMVAERFADYDGNYQFRISFTPQHGFSISSFDTNIFYDGSEHHIYGEVELFGVKFKNDSEEPLVFQISDGKYVYVKGN